MATTVGSVKGSERTSMERFGSGGMALLPWTKQMLTVLWEQLRLLVQVIYYSFMSVFQMFRFEVHVRITDETGQHIQHMTTAANPTESFLFSSLFDGDNGVMVGGSNPLSNFCADEALLSGLRADDLCCGLVDDFVSRTAGKEEGIFLGHQSTWKMGFPSDWNIFVSSSDSSGSNDTYPKKSEKVFKQDTMKEKVFRQDTSEEERSSHWSSEEDQNVVEFESEESKALWESLSKSSDPYNPLFFSACISTSPKMGKSEVKDSSASDFMSVNKAAEEMLGSRGLNIWVSRSDSESSWSSWASSDGSTPDIDKEESERLWEFFSSPEDPYNPMCFTACTVSKTTLQTTSTLSEQQASLPAPPSKSETDTEEKESSFPPSSEDDDEEQLWMSLCQKDDPYHPLNFQACLQSSSSTTTLHRREDPDSLDVNFEKKSPKKGRKRAKGSQKSRASKPILAERQLKPHSHPDKTLIPWKRPGQTPPGEKKDDKASTTQKKVQFSPLVKVHVMRSWPFARQASRKGHWEEMARDRDRFRRRIRETEQAIGHCFTHSHREKIQAYLDRALK
uniref:Protein phosphatase 1, regulatory subunit 15B n=1 Tax=Acanthochromis polyacanthus TaxID=80966 RepID=A0A3Q1GI60_9TELE